MKTYRRLCRLIGYVLARLRAWHISMSNPGLHLEGRCRFGPRCDIRAVDGPAIHMRDCHVESDCMIVADHGGQVVMEGCFIGKGAVIVARECIRIGCGSKIAEYAVLRDQNHRFDDMENGIAEQGFDVAPIVIGRNVWIGAKATILKGTVIGDGAIIGAHALVNRDVAPGTVVAGIPARIIRSNERAD